MYSCVSCGSVVCDAVNRSPGERRRPLPRPRELGIVPTTLLSLECLCSDATLPLWAAASQIANGVCWTRRLTKDAP